MDVFFGSIRIESGKKYSLDVPQYPPTIVTKLNADKYYTIFVVDKDAPSKENPINRYWLHYMSINNYKNFNSGKIIIDYKPPTPPKGSGEHRYFVCLYASDYKISPKFTDRPKFNMKHFIEEFGLALIDCIMFICEN